jgi:RNA 2',3'-cyclic 3'-phosphodiesterase
VSACADGPRLRLFAALVPPPEVLADLAAAVARTRAVHPALRWTEDEAWHVTLAFYGQVAEDRVPELCERLARAAHRHPRLGLSVGGAGRFGQRVRWMGLAGDIAGLARLADSARSAGRRVGVPTDGGPYRAHLTLARAGRTPTDLRPLVEVLRDHAGPGWVAGEVALVHSRPDGRPRYATLDTWPLGGA